MCIPVSALQRQDHLYQPRVLWSAHEGVLCLDLDNCFESLRTRMVHSNFIHLCLWCVFFRCMEKIAWIQRTTHGVRVCLLGALTDSGAPALLVPGVTVCLHHHCHGKPPHHSHGDLWFQAQHTHVFPAGKSGCFRSLFLLSHCPKDADGLPHWEEDHLLPGLHGPDLLFPPLGRWDCLLPLSDGYDHYIAIS